MTRQLTTSWCQHHPSAGLALQAQCINLSYRSRPSFKSQKIVLEEDPEYWLESGFSGGLHITFLLGMHRIIWPFWYTVSGRIPETAAGYPAKYATQELYINTAYNIPRSFDFMWPKATLCDLMWPFMIPCDLMWPQQSSYDPPLKLSQSHLTSCNLMWPQPASCDSSYPHGTSAALLRHQPSSFDLGRFHMTSVELTHVTFIGLM